MKYFIAIALIAAVASAGIVRPTGLRSSEQEIQQIIAAINSPSTNPATAAALEAMLLDVMGVGPAIVETAPISVGPAIVDFAPISVGPAIIGANPIAVGPAMIDFPNHDGGAVTAVEPAVIPPVTPVAVAAPSPVVVGEIPTGSSPLVQIILNINQAAAESVITPAPVATPVVQAPIVPGPVNIVESADMDLILPSPVSVIEEAFQPGPVNVVENIDVTPVEAIQVATPVIVEPVQVATPVVIEPVIVGTPIFPAPAVVLPETLN